MPRLRTPPVSCFDATYSEPCGASAWALRLPGGKVTAFVRGRGAPDAALDLTVLRAGNHFRLCGAMATAPVVDAECGAMPLFLADRFQIDRPIHRLRCGEGFGLFDGCMDAAGKPVYVSGPADLAPADLQDPRAPLRCDAEGCRIE